MTKLPALPLPASADEAEQLVAERTKELNAIRDDIETAERGLYGLAETDDDEKFEAETLKIERLRRAELRAEKREISAQAALAIARDTEEQARRQNLYEAGQAACREAEKLITGKYKTHAAELGKILGRLDELYQVVKVANDNLPEGMCARDNTIDLDSFRHEPDTPASTKIEIETYFDEPEDRPSSWNVREVYTKPTRTPKTRERTVYVRGWKGEKLSPLTRGVTLPAAVYGDADFWPKAAR